ncbi:MAG: tetratricopeptide repeat protein [Chthoniobacterales bacterium]|nr:tetratricopeptide repeat protein [Chthoniobacterales bacterium]
MNIRKIATIMVLVLCSFAASGVSPSKTELEGMYNKAFGEFDANNYEQALKDLDAIDARQPDLAESQNLRGVIMMRQQEYDKAEAALRKALAADPKFWNARFNLAEVPFLQKQWPEARQRFQDLLSENASDLQGEATQLIQYKILLTHLMEGKENMVQSMIAQFELTPDMPAVHYANAAIALSKKEQNDAKEWLTRAEKAFSPQLNKLFAESLYTIGWLEKPAGQTRAALELSSAAERAEQTKAFARAKMEEAEQALQQRDFTAARKLVDEAEAADPNQTAIINLRGEILLEQKDYNAAEAEFQKAAQADPKFRDAQYNLAQVPFRKGEYAKARERFEALFSTTTGADKDRAAQLLKYKVYLTYLLEGQDARADKMREQFQFTGDTPALYYAQAAREFKDNNIAKANDWVNSARKIYPAALNSVFSDAFYDLGWLQSSAAEPAAPVVAEATPQPGDTAPAIEPTPIPAVTLAQNDRAPTAADPLSSLAAEPSTEVPGMEAITSGADETLGASSMIGAAASPSVETPVASTASPAAAQPVVARAPSTGEEAPAGAAASPATALAPATVRDWAEPSLGQRFEQLSGGSTMWVLVLVLAGILLLTGLYFMIPELRRRFSKSTATRTAAAPMGDAGDESEPVAGGAIEQLVGPTRLAGGPPQVSLQLRASEPALRRAVMPVGKGGGRSYGNGHGGEQSSGYTNGHGNGHSAAVAGAVSAPAPAFVQSETFDVPSEQAFAEGVGEPQGVIATAETAAPAPAFFAEPAPAAMSFAGAMATAQEPAVTEPIAIEEPIALEQPLGDDQPVSPEMDVPGTVERTFDMVEEEAAPATFEAPAFEAPVETDDLSPAAATEVTEPEPFTAPVEAVASPEPEEFIDEPIGQGQPIPYLAAATAGETPMTAEAPPEPQLASAIAAALAGVGALRHSVTRTTPAPEPVPAEPIAQQQPTQTDIMPQPTQSTPAPAIHGPQPGGVAPQPAAAGMQQPFPAMQTGAMPQQGGAPAPGGMQTAVQLTFSFEIASLQLTPTFKMGSLQLKPTSKIVTMSLAPSQQPQPAMNLQVTFEIAMVQLAGNAIGMIRLTPSQQQRPGIVGTPSFNITGLQLVSGADAAPVQLTPSQQGQASVLVTAGFQIATVEFSPSFEIASIILNSTSRNVNVQLPGTGPSAVEGAPVFEMTSVQLGGNGEISVMQLNPPGTEKRA